MLRTPYIHLGTTLPVTHVIPASTHIREKATLQIRLVSRNDLKQVS